MDKVIGVLGGGQLGRMLAEAANRLNIKVIALAEHAQAPLKQITSHSHVTGSFKNRDDIEKLAELCDIITIEIEHVDADMLLQLEARGVVIEPRPETIKLIQNKFNQKKHLEALSIPVAKSLPLSHNNVAELQEIANKIGFPFMLKASRDAYDGRGNFAVKSTEDFDSAFKAFGIARELYAEKWVQFEMEVAVMVVQTQDETMSFPLVETIHENSICKLVYAPPRNLSREIRLRAEELAIEAIATFKGKGVFAVEMFVLPDGSLLVNEIAPRPHNSGHYTIEGCRASQYEAHIRAILDLPIPSKRLALRTPSIMLNILGGADPYSHMTLVQEAASGNGTVHLYGKGEGSPGRKMGHITLTAASMVEAEAEMEPLIQKFNQIVAASAMTGSERQQKALVGVIMGSKSDFSRVKPGLDMLEQYQIPHERHIVSAHRTPDYMKNYANTAASRGIKVIIAAAGGAAHLPGMVAAQTTLPVIGVPIQGSVLDGEDSLLSIVQMPRGVPVATVGINNSVNAALLAIRMLGAYDERIESLVHDQMESAAMESLESDQLLQRRTNDDFIKASEK